MKHTTQVQAEPTKRKRLRGFIIENGSTTAKTMMRLITMNKADNKVAQLMNHAIESEVSKMQDNTIWSLSSQ